MTLSEFLAQKPLYYAEIDYTRMPRAYTQIKEALRIPKIIHVVGTNGKGTTGRYIANALLATGFSVGHYSSPHIQHYNERIWLNGQHADDALLEAAHQRLQTLLDETFLRTLSYFEYTTFLAMLVYAGCDYVVLEAGLGGEYDATNVFEKVLSVITPIGMDHQDFLGHSIEAIAKTKMRSVSHEAIVARQVFDAVWQVARALETENGVRFIDVDTLIDEDMLSLAEVIKQEQELAFYLYENLLLAMSVLKKLGITVKKNLFISQRLEGRMQRIAPNVWLDVGHNALAAEAISRSFLPNSVILVYNSYKDKDYRSILSLLRPIIRRVEIISIDDDRIVSPTDLKEVLEDLGVEYTLFEGISEDEEYLVFGSFSVAEAFYRLR